MPRLTRSRDHWQSERFASTLKNEIEKLPPGALPLHEATTQGGHVDDSNIAATILSVSDHGRLIHARVGIFFSEIVGGCNCGDDPVSANAYCELHLAIDKDTAETGLTPAEPQYHAG